MSSYKKYHYYKCKDMFIMSKSNYHKFEKCYDFPEIPQRIKRREIPSGATVLKTWLVHQYWNPESEFYMRASRYESLIIWKG